MSQSFQELDAVLLWPDGTPGSLGDTPEDRPVLRPFVRPQGDPVAAVIVCPGGGYSGRARHEANPIAQWFNSLGLASFVLEYRVAPYRHPQPLNDAQRAVRIVRLRGKQWGVDPNRIGILGFSAGGHLATWAATIFDAGKADAKDPVERQSSRPDLLIACYPVISFGQFRHQGSMENLLGPNPDERLVKELTLEDRVTPQTPPTFLWHTANDGAVPAENSIAFASALSRNKVSFALHVFPDAPHGVGLATDRPHVRKWTELCADFLEFREFIPTRK